MPVDFNRDMIIPQISLHIFWELNGQAHSCLALILLHTSTIWFEMLPQTFAIWDELNLKFSFQKPELVLEPCWLNLSWWTLTVHEPRSGVCCSKPHDKAPWASKLNQWSCGGCEALYWWDCSTKTWQTLLKQPRRVSKHQQRCTI